MDCLPEAITGQYIDVSQHEELRQTIPDRELVIVDLITPDEGATVRTGHRPCLFGTDADPAAVTLGDEMVFIGNGTENAGHVSYVDLELGVFELHDSVEAFPNAFEPQRGSRPFRDPRTTPPAGPVTEYWPRIRPRMHMADTSNHYNEPLNALVAEAIACSPDTWREWTLTVECDGAYYINYKLKNEEALDKARISDGLRGLCENLYVAMRDDGDVWMAATIHFFRKEHSWSFTAEFEYPGASQEPPAQGGSS